MQHQSNMNRELARKNKESLDLKIPSKITAIFTKYKYYNPNKVYTSEEEKPLEKKIPAMHHDKSHMKYLQSFRDLKIEIEKEPLVLEEPPLSTRSKSKLPSITRRPSVVNRKEFNKIETTRIDKIASMNERYKEKLLRKLFQRQPIIKAKAITTSPNKAENVQSIQNIFVKKRSCLISRKKAIMQNGIPFKDRHQLYFSGKRADDDGMLQKIKQSFDEYVSCIESDANSSASPKLARNVVPGIDKYFSYQLPLGEELSSYDYQISHNSIERFDQVLY